VDGLYQGFEKTAARFGERVAVEVVRRDGLESWSYAKLDRAVRAVASSLVARGVRPGDRCALLANNDADWCAAFLAVLRVGAVAVPLDTAYSPQQVARLLADCEARLILTGPSYEATVAEALATLDEPCPSFPVRPEPGTAAAVETPAAAVERDRTAVILYTSGTTSDPKGVVLTHGNLLAEIEAAFHLITIHEQDSILGVLPLFHALALLANLLLPFFAGARVVFLESLNTAQLIRTLQERDISMFCCVPQFFYLIHQRVLEQVGKSGRIRRFVFHALLKSVGILRERTGINLGRRIFGRVHAALGPSMRLLVTGGSRFDPQVGRDLYRLGFNILQAYGLTETSGASTVLRPNDPHIASVGQALPGVELKILPPAADQESGEVAVRGAIVTPGYYRRDDVNAVTFKDGWFLTGDLGYLDDEGRLYITGRAKEVIVLGSGKNVYPEEIEAHYLQSPFIKELCVMGRSRPDAPAAERLHAVVVPDFELLRERKIVNSREVMRFEIETLSSQLPGTKRIMSYDVVSHDLPRTTTRKLKRFQIERELEQRQPEDDGGGSQAEQADAGAWDGDPHATSVLANLRERVEGRPAIGPASNLELDLGLDSMERVELLAELEARFGVTIPEEVTQGIHTVGELVEALRAEGGAAAVGESDLDPWRLILSDVSDDDPAVAPILVERPVAGPLLYAGSRAVYLLSRLLLGLQVSGREQLPAHGPYLICPNHQSYLDAFILAGALPQTVFRDAFYVGASEYFEGRIGSWGARLTHVVPVDPDSNLVRAMRAGAHGLRGGRILVLFPEGERSIDAEIKTFKKGAAILSANVGVPIVPVALDGLAEIWPRAGWPRLHKLLPFVGERARIRFGSPLEPGKRQSEEAYAALTARLRRAVVELLEKLRRPV
jgi:long-chain acyl-CoA synthetase